MSLLILFEKKKTIIGVKINIILLFSVGKLTE